MCHSNNCIYYVDHLAYVACFWYLHYTYLSKDGIFASEYKDKTTPSVLHIHNHKLIAILLHYDYDCTTQLLGKHGPAVIYRDGAELRAAARPTATGWTNSRFINNSARSATHLAAVPQMHYLHWINRGSYMICYVLYSSRTSRFICIQRRCCVVHSYFSCFLFPPSPYYKYETSWVNPILFTLFFKWEKFYTLLVNLLCV